MRSSVTPPEISTFARPRGAADGLADVVDATCCRPASMSAPASSASSTSSSVCASTSTRRPGGALARARDRRRDAAGQPDVVVLDQDRVEQPEAVVGRRRRRDGVFLERSQRRRRLPRVEHVMRPAAASTNWRVRVAMPDSRCRKLSAVRSPTSSARARARRRRAISSPAGAALAVALVRPRSGQPARAAGMSRPRRRARPARSRP